MSTNFARAAAARGRSGRADEPEMEDREEPVHESHGGTCYSCGGPVDRDGKYADGGEVLEKEYEPDDHGEGYSRVEVPEARRSFARAAKERR